MQQVPVQKSAADIKLHDDLKRAGGPYTKHGAGLLADHINAYWAARERGVKAERYDLAAEGHVGWGVRSNLVNGLPPRKVPIKAEPAKSIEQRRAEAMHGA